MQIFESHAGTLPPALPAAAAAIEPVGDVSDSALPEAAAVDALSRWSFTPIARMIAGIRQRVPEAKVIVFCRGSGLDGHARVVPETGADAVGVDWSVDLKALRDRVPAHTVTQGNVHPDTLIAGGDALDAAVDAVLDATRGLPHIFNLGHGITPQTPVAHVERMLARLRGA